MTTRTLRTSALITLCVASTATSAIADFHLNSETRNTEASARQVLSGLFIFQEDKARDAAPSVFTAPNRSWISQVSALSTPGGQLSSSMGWATQRSLIRDLDGTDFSGPLAKEKGAVVVANGRSTLSEWSIPTLNWTSEADAHSQFEVTFTIDEPHQFRSLGYLVSSPDDKPIDGTSGGVPDGFQTDGDVSVTLSGTTGPIFAQRLSHRRRHKEIRRINEAGILPPGTYTFRAAGSVLSNQKPAQRQGQSEAAWSALLDLAPVGTLVDPKVRWDFPVPFGIDPSLDLSPAEELEYDAVAFPFDVMRSERHVVAHAVMSDGPTILDEEGERFAAAEILPFSGAATAVARDPSGDRIQVSAGASQRSFESESDVLRVFGRAATLAGHDDAPVSFSGSAASESSYEVVFLLHTATVVRILGDLEVRTDVDPNAPSLEAQCRLARITPAGDVSLFDASVQSGSTVTDQDIDRTFSIPAGRYRLFVAAEAIAQGSGPYGVLGEGEFEIALIRVEDR